ncbi:GLPGLI family protein [Soonwooa sp.]|uniref:GLPGLI family protein n=1 Tax=Soonwooa sp. TaxID=1938592 RepID=UPI00261B678B|nr:GLPGLI family protein [Soonwooa sp.]
MKLLLKFIAIFIINLSFAQQYKVVYEMKFKPTKAKDSIVTENFVLMINPSTNSSKFFNYNYYYSDSLMTVIRNKNLQRSFDININSFRKANYPLGVVKNSKNIFLIKSLDGDSYKIREDKPKWNVSSEKKAFKSYTLQKATATILGRNWTVWFSNEIPVSDGPYLFKDLPGLVFSGNDDASDFNFDLLSLEKSNSIEDYFPSIFAKTIDVTAEQYAKAYKQYTLDPAKQLRNGIFVDDSGIKVNMLNGISKDIIIDMEKDRILKIKKFNNFIDAK